MLRMTIVGVVVGLVFAVHWWTASSGVAQERTAERSASPGVKVEASIVAQSRNARDTRPGSRTRPRLGTSPGKRVDALAQIRAHHSDEARDHSWADGRERSILASFATAFSGTGLRLASADCRSHTCLLEVTVRSEKQYRARLGDLVKWQQGNADGCGFGYAGRPSEAGTYTLTFNCPKRR